MGSLFLILLVFVLVLIHSRWMNLGYSLAAGSVVLALLTGMAPKDFGASFYTVFLDRGSMGLVLSIVLILVLSEALKAGGQLDRLVAESRKIFHDIRLTVFVLPALVGFLPMPGGAHFSAPMVDSVFRDLPLSQEKKSFANYWFRHVWEYIMPIYPGIVAAAALTGLEFASLVKANIFLTLTAILAGLAITFNRKMPVRKTAYRGSFKSVFIFLRELSPVLAVVSLAAFLKLDLNLALLIGVALALILGGKGISHTPGIFKNGIKIDVIIMLLGILLFRNVVSDSGVVNSIALFMETNDIGVLPVIFGLSFLSGFVTGITIAFVGITFPIILTMIEPDPWNMMFIFASGFAGVLLSPVHLCLVLSNRYFNAVFVRVYRYLIPASAAVVATGLAGYLLFG